MSAIAQKVAKLRYLQPGVAVEVEYKKGSGLSEDERRSDDTLFFDTLFLSSVSSKERSALQIAEAPVWTGNCSTTPAWQPCLNRSSADSLSRSYRRPGFAMDPRTSRAFFPHWVIPY
jgi:hypothetical protein